VFIEFLSWALSWPA